MDWALIAAALLLVIFYAYSRLRRQLNYWSDRGVFVENPSFPMGNLNGYGKRHFCDNMQVIYDKFARRDVFCGFYFATSARALILDLELLKHVMIKDFQYFADRKSYFNERDDPLSAHLFNQRGAKWRLMRQQLSPTFTSGKMKMMFDLVAGETSSLVEATERKLGSDIDCKDLFMRYIADVIGMCAFGLDCQSLRNDDAAIIKMGHKVFELNNFAFLFQSTFEDLALWMKMRLFKKEATDYFYSVIKNTVDNREQNNIKRKDFMNLLIELKNHGKFVDDNESENLGKITFNELAAQAFIFMVAGFETTSTTMQFCLLELAKNQDIQQRVRDEVNEVLRKHNGKWTYESLQELHYLNMCINESMRKWPAVFILMRNTLKDYKVPNTTHILEKDTQIIIPTWCIHRDPKYYPDPERFDPDRFLPENEKARHPMAFIPFGDGPRNCIGMRFAYLQMKLGLASVISRFKFTLSPQTRFEVDPTNLFITVKTGAWVRAEKL